MGVVEGRSRARFEPIKRFSTPRWLWSSETSPHRLTVDLASLVVVSHKGDASASVVDLFGT